jgi:hypothetical protein
MAGDGCRVPDVSEQRARMRVGPEDTPNPDEWDEVLADPASVLAALLAESPEATVAAIEALLMGEEAVQAAEHSLRVSARCCLSDAEAATFALSAACRSLLSKAPKGDG